MAHQVTGIFSDAHAAERAVHELVEGSVQALQGAIRGGLNFAGDPFGCGTVLAPTPATCSPYNRGYTEHESACINR